MSEAERLDFDSFWLMDHLHQIRNFGQPSEPMLESWVALSYAAGLSSKLKLGTLVTAVIYRHPSLLAKMGATLDVLAKGRTIMGVGAGWNKEETLAYGIPFPRARERLDRVEEAVQILKKMWTQEVTNFDGKYYRIRGAYCNPKPIQVPYPPILIAGGGEKRTLQIVAQHANACNLFGSPDTVRRKLSLLRTCCKTIGRNYDEILKTKLSHVIIVKDDRHLREAIREQQAAVPDGRWREGLIAGTPDQVRRHVQDFQDAGIDHLIVNFGPRSELEGMELFAEQVVDQF